MCIRDSENIVIITEYVEGYSLSTYLKRITDQGRQMQEEEILFLLKQMLGALAYCHALLITHRDVKLENILLDQEGNIKIIDFGLSTKMPANQRTKLFCGTPTYMAPELVAKKEHAGPPTDIWALGVLLFALCTGTFPFRGLNDKELYKKISRAEFETPEGVPPKLRGFIFLMLHHNPDKRPTAAELLSDPVFEDIGSVNIYFHERLDADEAPKSNDGGGTEYVDHPRAEMVSTVPTSDRHQLEEDEAAQNLDGLDCDKVPSHGPETENPELHRKTIQTLVSMGYDEMYVLKKIREGSNHIKTLYDRVCHLQALKNCQDLSLIHISEPTRLGMISYAVFCLKKKNKQF
eukprot:TRINITY_DN10677_c0_g1_i2.p1 TRINITY_DN10677_c0_g1~~TRINITY_DN10677_c0_g1_i2.p1  ORF type:complete len:348 (+),score=74.67 TRINITY_DN10677_c0_g1_i2:63-1106(+)